MFLTSRSPRRRPSWAIIRSKHADFQPVKAQPDEAWDMDVEKLIVSREGYDKMKAELDRLVTVEMVNISKELTKVADVSADMQGKRRVQRPDGKAGDA